MDSPKSQSVPVVKGWPLLGILPNLFSGDPFEYLKNIMLEYGDLVQLKIGNQQVYLASNPDYLQRILRDNYQNYRKSDTFYDSLRAVAGNGLFTSSGDLWLRQRRMVQPHLHRKQLVYLFDDMVDAINEVLSHWILLAQNNVEVEMGEQMREFSINIITRSMFGKGTLEPEEFMETGYRATRIAKYVGTAFFSGMLPKWFPIIGKDQFDQDRTGVQETVKRIIARCRKDKELSAGLIQMLLNEVDEESQQQMSEQQLIDEVMSIFIAGYETTATVLTWLSVIIYKYPDILAKLQAEIDDVLGGRTPSFEDVPRLSYARQVFMEILRMYTVAPFVPRTLNQADQLGNGHIPANAMVLVFFHGVHHNPKVWDEPEVFNPDRFRPNGSTVGQHQFAYVPFSGGPRKCAGEEFTMLEGPLIMAMMLQKYTINVLPNQTFDVKMGSTIHPYSGVKATISSRKL